MGGACGTYGAGERSVQGSVGIREGKRPLGRPRRRWEDNIKINLQEMRGGCVDWMELVQDRERWWAFVGTVMKKKKKKCREFLE
jgi:hypothetical protein